MTDRLTALPVLAAASVVFIVVAYATGLLPWDRSVIGLLAVGAIVMSRER